MNNKSKISLWFLKVATTQAYLSAVSLPFLAFWGLPLSIASFLGNVIISPIIVSFIFISSLVFFSELFYLPNGLLIFLLEANSWLIIKFIGLGSAKWLYGIRASYLLLLLPFVSTAIIFSLKDKARLLALVIALSLTIFVVKVLPAPKFEETLKCGNSKVLVSKDQSGVVSLSCKPGIVKSKSFDNWAEYKLLPLLYKKTGLANIDIVNLAGYPGQERILKKHFNMHNISIKSINIVK